MSLLPFTFDEERHIYSTPGRYVLSTSDCIDLAGLSDMSQIPADILRYACYRGKSLHKAIELYEMGEDWQEGFDHDFMPYMEGWFAFRDNCEIQVLPPCECQYVYVHEGTDHAIGGTIDLRFIYNGHLYIGDVKSIHPVYGKALRQKQLAWRLQGQSYVEATLMDEAFLSDLSFQEVRRAFIHIHPKLKQKYALHEFTGDDSLLWDSCVRMATAKLAAGMMPSKRNDVAEMETV